MTGSPLPREALRRIVASLVTAEIARTRGGAAAGIAVDPIAWSDARTLTVGSIELDSLELVHAAAALYEMFDLDALPSDGEREQPATVGQWLDAIAAVQRRGDATLNVMTSGSTGRPKRCPHALQDLRDEAAHFASVLPPVRRVIALAPAHHIYGLLWTALLPAMLDVPVVSASVAALPRLETGDLLVGVPDHWAAVARSITRWPDRVCGVSAGAPLDDGLAGDLRSAGLAALYDVYGTSETGGIAVRQAPDAPYALLPRWQFVAPIGADAATIVDQQGSARVLPDRLAMTPDGRFAIGGRNDGAVQVGGVNVWPEQVAAVLRRGPGVSEISVRLGEHHRLKAYVVPSGTEDTDILHDRLRQHAHRLLLPEQRPTAYTFGSALPRNAMGKVCDWS
ncbi:AMP-binding protein [Sphingomonas sp. CARO-RG-8B-R24-01]|uniref:AMP-binding protein n=1 Tax=Sphingomonas sp. CARO-RG-8B-R24-01 TaxID=2914831 RepID=UPI001F578771|nr:AMP-binding protein [Sphingomonas sp. CARO-RG-8B-R24-01]